MALLMDLICFRIREIHHFEDSSQIAMWKGLENISQLALHTDENTVEFHNADLSVTRSALTQLLENLHALHDFKGFLLLGVSHQRRLIEDLQADSGAAQVKAGLAYEHVMKLIYEVWAMQAGQYVECALVVGMQCS